MLLLLLLFHYFIIVIIVRFYFSVVSIVLNAFLKVYCMYIVTQQINGIIKYFMSSGGNRTLTLSRYSPTLVLLPS